MCFERISLQNIHAYTKRQILREASHCSFDHVLSAYTSRMRRFMTERKKNSAAHFISRAFLRSLSSSLFGHPSIFFSKERMRQPFSKMSATQQRQEKCWLNIISANLGRYLLDIILNDREIARNIWLLCEMTTILNCKLMNEHACVISRIHLWILCQGWVISTSELCLFDFLLYRETGYTAESLDNKCKWVRFTISCITFNLRRIVVSEDILGFC